MAVADKQSIWNYLSRCNLNNAAVAGIMGNMQAESSFDLAAVGDRGTSFGLCQWHDDRGRNMKAYCSEYGGNWESNLNGQLGYLMLELTDPTFMRDATCGVDLLGKLRNVSNTYSGVREASNAWLKYFERPTDQSTEVQDKRYVYSKTIYDTYANKTTSSNTSSSNSNSNITYRDKPVSYLQWDSRWGSIMYSNHGDTGQTIGTSGCGPTCAAMVVATLADSSVTPENAAAYSIKNGYRTYNNGTSWGFFKPYFAQYSIPCQQTSSYNEAITALGNGYMVIAAVGEGLWTRGGHFILLYGLVDGGTTLLVNDPNSTSEAKTRAHVSNLAASDPEFWIIPVKWTTATPSASDVSNAYTNNTGGALANSTAASSVNYRTEYREVTTEVKTSTIYTADVDANAQRTRANNLLTTPTLVESPFIWLTIGNYTFGSYSINGSYDSVNSNVTVNYPNYMTGIKITKVNGQVNQYVITMVYQIRNGDDPNLLDKIFSSVGYGKVHISYGDWNAPKFIYQDEEAIITKLSTNVDFANSRITYTLNCTSNALVLMSNCHSEPAGTLKPSQRIHDMIYSEESKYGLQKVFTAFANNEAFFWECVSSDDVSVEVNAKTLIDPLNYINYLVTCMSPTTTSKTSPLRDANYYLTIREDKDKGTYFTIKKVSSSDGVISLNNSDVYEVDVGYPGDTLVTSFKINNDNSWSLLYNYGENINTNEYSYNIDSDGNIYTTYSPSMLTSNKYLKTTETQKSWWTQMTQFPITATLTIKGLLRPAMLMSYVRINALFYGLRHVSSGLYVITRQVDTIDSNGYRTELTLTRVAGDLDAIVTDTKLVTTLVPVYKVNS